MKTVIFEALSDQIDEFSACWASLLDAIGQMREINSSARSRITANQCYAADRKAELRRQIADTSRTATSRAMAQKELAQLESSDNGATPAEIEAFGDATKQAQQALEDWQKIRGELRVLFDGAEKHLAVARRETIGDHTHEPQLARNWIDSAQTEFCKLKI